MGDHEQTVSVALVTGASSGFGELTAKRLAREGYRVFGTSRGPHSGYPGVEMLRMDVDDDASVTRCVADVLARSGRVDLLVNNAGRAMLGACEETSASEARALFETNLFGVMRLVNAVLPSMRRQGCGAIVNVGSLSGFVGVPFHGAYAATKHALAGYSEALRLEVRPFGITVALVEPAAHRTQIQMIRPGQLQPLYDRGRERVGAIIRRQIEGGAAPERVVDAIVAAATAPAPHGRYRVGLKAVLGALARRLLPASVFEWALRREFQLSGTA
jgi:short-subunit dehydrogenase